MSAWHITSSIFLWVLCCLLGFGFCRDSFSILRMIYEYRYIYFDIIRTYADLTFFYFCLRCTICFSYDVYYLPYQVPGYCFLFVFSPEVIFRSRVTGTCPVTTDCIVPGSHELMWEQKKQENKNFRNSDAVILKLVRTAPFSQVRTPAWDQPPRLRVIADNDGDRLPPPPPTPPPTPPTPTL